MEKKLIVEKCNQMSNHDFEELYKDSFDSCGCYYDIENPETLLYYFAFSICTCFQKIVELYQIKNLNELIKLYKEKDYIYRDFIDIFVTPYVENIYHTIYAENILRKIILSNDKKYQVFKDIFTFKLSYPNNIMLEDLWNYHQWGKRESGELVIVDIGYNFQISNSKCYSKWYIQKNNIITSKPGDGMIFNGNSTDMLVDPEKNKVMTKFFTSKGSEYILSYGQRGMRIKNAGLSDDGLWDWSDKTVFVQTADMQNILNTVIKYNITTQMPIKVKFNKFLSNIIFKKINNKGLWETFFKVKNISLKPVIGMSPLEFLFDGTIIRGFHPGHEITYIEEY